MSSLNLRRGDGKKVELAADAQLDKCCTINNSTSALPQDLGWKLGLKKGFCEKLHLPAFCVRSNSKLHICHPPTFNAFRSKCWKPIKWFKDMSLFMAHQSGSFSLSSFHIWSNIWTLWLWVEEEDDYHKDTKETLETINIKKCPLPVSIINAAMFIKLKAVLFLFCI